MRSKLFSLFIMDVTNSSNFSDKGELTSYLKFWEEVLNQCTENTKIVAKYRMGDEIICVAEHYSTAYLLAYYILGQWKYSDAMPYFGLATGEFQVDFDEIGEVEYWQHPAIKRAREQSELIKHSQRETYWRLAKQETLQTLDSFDSHSQDNLLLKMQSSLIELQSEAQFQVRALYQLLESQKEVGHYLGKTQATISSLYSRGNSKLIQEIASDITNRLQKWEATQQTIINHRIAYPDMTDEKVYYRLRSEKDEQTMQEIAQEEALLNDQREKFQEEINAMLLKLMRRRGEVSVW